MLNTSSCRLTSMYQLNFLFPQSYLCCSQGCLFQVEVPQSDDLSLIPRTQMEGESQLSQDVL